MRCSSRKRQRKQAELKLEEQSSSNSSSRSSMEKKMSREEETKKRKILTERRRRERMDESYKTLEKILLTSGFYKKERESDASVEKAVILEQSVSYIQNLQKELQRLKARVYQENRTPNIGLVTPPPIYPAAFKTLNHSAPPVFKQTIDGTEFNFSRPSFASLPPSFNPVSPFGQPSNYFIPQLSTQFFNLPGTDINFDRESPRNFVYHMGHHFPATPLPHPAFQWHGTSMVGAPLQHSTPISDRTESSTKSSSGLGTSFPRSSMSSTAEKIQELSSSFLGKNIVQKFDLDSETETETESKNKCRHEKETKEKPIVVDQKTKPIWTPYF